MILSAQQKPPPPNNTLEYLKEQTNKMKGFHATKNEVLINKEDQGCGT